MSFFFKPSRPKTPQELVKAIKDSLMGLDTKTVVEVKALEKRPGDLNFVIAVKLSGDFETFKELVDILDRVKKFAPLCLVQALEEVEKNFVTMKLMLSGDGEVEPNMDHVSQLTLEICKEDVLALFLHKLPLFGWEDSSDTGKKRLGSLLVHTIKAKGWLNVLLCAIYGESFRIAGLSCRVVSYDNKDIALNCGNMLRECIKYPTLAKYILESPSFELFFKYVGLPNFDVASDAFSTFKDLLTKHATAVSEFLTAHYDEFFEQYEKLLTSTNYVTRRQSLKLLSEFLLEPPNSHIMKRYIAEVRHLKIMMTLMKDSSKNIQISAFHIFKVFVANPNKPRDIKVILAKNHERLLALLYNLSAGKGADDDQFEEEKELIIKEIERVSQLPNLES
ncbi:hypothetical protein RJ640_016379 [Escallonia rubra]|uniref:Uncharacterized protein n=1 Tax=Escallonia rubra TaxID=112253 RepID=A0AA88R3W4_9ASTE|nr:hypothetical protein RJ640_016379 [Escallonia rubra]